MRKIEPGWYWILGAVSVFLAGMILQNGIVSGQEGANLALGKSYVMEPVPNYEDTSDEADKTQLTNGKESRAYWRDREMVGWKGFDKVTVTIDLEKASPVGRVAVKSWGGGAGVLYSSPIEISSSNDGRTYQPAGSITSEGIPQTEISSYKFVVNLPAGSQTRYVKTVLNLIPGSTYIFCDEIEVYSEALPDKVIPSRTYDKSPFEWRALYHIETGKLKESMSNIAKIGFNVIFVKQRGRELEEIIGEAEKENIGIYLLYDPYLWPAEEVLEKHPEYVQVSHKEAKKGLTDKKKQKVSRWLCPDRPEVRQYFIDLLTKEIKTYNPQGISLDGIRYEEDGEPLGCYCPFSVEKRKEFVANHSELSPEQAERKFNEESIIGFIEEIRETVKSINPEIRIHGYSCYDEPVYKYRFPLDYHSKRASNGGWDISKTLELSKKYIARTQDVSKSTIVAPMIDFLSSAPKDAQRVSTEIKLVKQSGAKAIAVWCYDGLFYSTGEFIDTNVADAVSREFAEK